MTRRTVAEDMELVLNYVFVTSLSRGREKRELVALSCPGVSWPGRWVEGFGEPSAVSREEGVALYVKQVFFKDHGEI